MNALNRSANDILDHDLQRETHFELNGFGTFFQTSLHKLTQEKRIADERSCMQLQAKAAIAFPRRDRVTAITFVILLILATVRSRNKIVPAITSYRIAANLLEGGRTSH
ncbi:hypothetical protein RF11_00774 [Thelohanellus kitauei]|uniref:Uncharacterized protein n=1 Tax=Thelohanellus kitauei TaxID=669202 RepID=A0A0C2J0M1_THEKT|nr:hypothetical protein RF11_00774 [Thelohanellus kitauei]